jgi:23S rRNA pseudouridine1911/1915/1917 synthase
LDSDVIVVDKPAGMVTLRHATERNWTEKKKQLQPALDDVVPELISRRDVSSDAGGNRIFSVHRIDRDTSGLVVFARSAKSRDALIRQFKKHAIERAYLAITCGSVSAGTIRSYLVDDRGDGKRGSTKIPGEGKLAVTHLRPLETLNGLTLVECRLQTGRTHQIRIHLSESGHPVYGDVKYGTPAAQLDLRSGIRSKPTTLPRLALHASILGFCQPTSGEPLRFESPLPPEMRSFIEHLRRPREM